MDNAHTQTRKRPLKNCTGMCVLGLVILVVGAVVKLFPHEVQSMLDFIFGV